MVDVWAPWCGPCLQLSSTIEDVALAYQGKAVVGKLNFDEAKATAEEFDVSVLPTLLFFKDGELVETIEGIVSYEDITNTIDKHRTSVMRKLDVHSATELVTRAFRDGLLGESDID